MWYWVIEIQSTMETLPIWWLDLPDQPIYVNYFVNHKLTTARHYTEKQRLDLDLQCNQFRIFLSKPKRVLFNSRRNKSLNHGNGKISQLPYRAWIFFSVELLLLWPTKQRVVVWKFDFCFNRSSWGLACTSRMCEQRSTRTTQVRWDSLGSMRFPSTVVARYH
jgi:hypothetical protein